MTTNRIINNPTNTPQLGADDVSPLRLSFYGAMDAHNARKLVCISYRLGWTLKISPAASLLSTHHRASGAVTQLQINVKFKQTPVAPNNMFAPNNFRQIARWCVDNACSLERWHRKARPASSAHAWPGRCIISQQWCQIIRGSCGLKIGKCFFFIEKHSTGRMYMRIRNVNTRYTKLANVQMNRVQKSRDNRPTLHSAWERYPRLHWATRMY